MSRTVGHLSFVFSKFSSEFMLSSNFVNRVVILTFAPEWAQFDYKCDHLKASLKLEKRLTDIYFSGMYLSSPSCLLYSTYFRASAKRNHGTLSILPLFSQFRQLKLEIRVEQLVQSTVWYKIHNWCREHRVSFLIYSGNNSYYCSVLLHG